MSAVESIPDLEERIAFLGKLWEEVKDLDDFTESEKIAIQTELELCQEKLSCLQENANRKDEADETAAAMRQTVLNRIFETAPKSVHDLMSIFLAEQTRLESCH